MNRFLIYLLILFIPMAAFAVEDTAQPEAATAVPSEQNPEEATNATKAMVAAANPLAVEAGLNVLKDGGSAVDAAIATQLVLNIVEPQSSGIGGGGFMLVYDADTKRLHAYDGRETAPGAVTEMLFLNEFGEPLDFKSAVESGKSVGAPGLVRLMEMAHNKHGKLAWNELFGDAITLAESGFEMSPRLHKLLASTTRKDVFARSFTPYVTEKGDIKAVGELVLNPQLAATLQAIAENGADAFYRGAIADDIIHEVQMTAPYPGKLHYDDLKNYQAIERRPICNSYRTYRICSMPAPSSGGIAILQALKILELKGKEFSEQKADSPKAAHLIIEASKLAFADRNHYIGDPEFEEIPTDELLSDHYLETRAALIDASSSMGIAEYGSPADALKQGKPSPTTEEHPSTTHISVIDEDGNAVSMTTSIEQGFGSGISSGGFFLNNQLTDFNFSPYRSDEEMSTHPNRVKNGKRPRSSMSPTMVFDRDGNLLMVIGSPGGARIITYVLQTIIGVLDWGMDMQTAINQPHFLNLNRAETELEKGTKAEKLKKSLEKLGHQVKITIAPSGLHGIRITEDGLEGGADPRREGVAKGY